jgi:hypothetical protein
MAFFPTDALARRCTDESVRLATAPSGSAESALPESTGALLHHQPTAAEVAAAEIEDEKRKSDALDRARELDLDGKEAACLAALREISHSDNDALARRRLASQPQIRKICRSLCANDPEAPEHDRVGNDKTFTADQLRAAPRSGGGLYP